MSDAGRPREVLRPPIEPMLATLARDIELRNLRLGRYVFEPKYDGYRGLLFVTGASCVVQSRRGHDVSRCFPEIAAAASQQLLPGPYWTVN